MLANAPSNHCIFLIEPRVQLFTTTCSTLLIFQSGKFCRCYSICGQLGIMTIYLNQVVQAIMTFKSTSPGPFYFRRTDPIYVSIILCVAK